MKTQVECVTVSPNGTDNISIDQTVPNKSEKRSLDEDPVTNLDEIDEERKKLKISDVGEHGNGNNGKSTMSKRQFKKIQKQQKWLEGKGKRKEISKERKQEKKKLTAQMRQAGIEIQKAKLTKMAESTCKQRIVLDMSYDHLMSDKDLCKCSSQILRCYGVNRRMENPMQLYICSYEGKIKENLSKHIGSEFWDLNYMEDSFNKLFKAEELVYLTSESPNVLENICESKVYVVGGLVDHNSYKGESLRIANQLGIAHAKLPIDKYIMMKSRQTLTIIHVYEIISKVVTGMSWKDALIETLPKRNCLKSIDDDDYCSIIEQTKEGNKTKVREENSTKP